MRFAPGREMSSTTGKVEMMGGVHPQTRLRRLLIVLECVQTIYSSNSSLYTQLTMNIVIQSNLNLS